MCIDRLPGGDAGQRPAAIHSWQPPKSGVKHGLIFREKNVLAATRQPSDREGKPDFFSPMTFALGLLGGTPSEEGPEVELPSPLPEAAPMKQANKAPVFLSKDKVKMVHEPNEGEGCIPIDMSKEKVFKETFPKPERKWDGGWYGSEESRLEYLRLHYRLWGFCKPEECKRKTNVFFIPKKDGRLRKILACVNFNNCCEQPPKCRLPGTWNIQKIRFTGKRFFSAESDVSAYYSRLQAPDWMKYYLCLDEVLIEEIVEMSEEGTYFCPYTGQTFSRGQKVCPCWPRLPMGWNWSVYFAVDLADRLLVEAQKKLDRDMQQQTTSLNITKRGFVDKLNGPFQGCYIDNLFSLGPEPRVLNTVHKYLIREFQAQGLVMSEDDPAKSRRKLLGVDLVGEENRIKPPEKFVHEVAYFAVKKRVRVWEFDKIMGKCAWLFPLHRRFFSILSAAYRLLSRVRRGLDSGSLDENDILHLDKAVRREFGAVWTLTSFLHADLTERSAGMMYAADSSLEGYAFVSAKTEPKRDWIHDTGLVFGGHAARVVSQRTWRVRRQKWFRYNLKRILSGEICAFRNAAATAARENIGKEILIYTDNSNVYHAITKGRSSKRSLNNLCRNILFLEIVYQVRIHARWCPSASMPADKFTRFATCPKKLDLYQ